METDSSTVGGPDPERPSPPPAGGSHHEPADQSTGSTGRRREQSSDPTSGHATDRAPGSATDDAPGQPADDSADPVGQGATAARAVLRPVPDGFPTPPTHPDRPTRRPSVQPPGESEPDPDPYRRRLNVVPLVVVAVLVLVVAIGGSILAYRALSPEPGPDAGPAATAGSDPAADAGDSGDDGVARNSGEAEGLIIEGDDILETMGGAMHEPLADSAAQYTAESRACSR